MDQMTAAALCEAGMMPVKEYVRLCAENGWSSRLLPDTGTAAE